MSVFVRGARLNKRSTLRGDGVVVGWRWRYKGSEAGAMAAALEAMRSTLSVWTADGFPADHADSMRAIERIEAELREDEA
jgi:hypothetical protein